jgi:hypothetical protein
MTGICGKVPMWVEGFRALLRKRGIPTLDQGNIAVLSDYTPGAGEHGYRVQSFLLFNPKRSPDWPRLRHNLRATFEDNRRFAYKSLRPSCLLQAHLEPFLSIANMLHGWCVTVAVHKSWRRIVSDDDSFELWRKKADLEERWNPAQFENMLEIVHFLSLLLAEVTRDCERVEWISDEDQIFANGKRCDDVTRVLGLCLHSYAPRAIRKMVVGTAEIDTGHRGIEDLLAITDLGAGAVADVTRSRHTGLALPQKATKIGQWLSSSSSTLCKCSIEFPPKTGDQVFLAPLEAELHAGGRYHSCQ